MAEDTWNPVALPILNAIAQIEHEDVDIISVSALAERANVDPGDAEAELELLMDGGFVRGHFLGGAGADRDYCDPGLAVPGARAVRRWPPEDVYDALVQILDQGISDEAIDPATRTKLQRFRDSLLQIGQSVATDFLVQLINSQMGLH
jgi:hypothetical protein